MDRIDVLIEEYKLINSKIEYFLQNQHKYINSLLLLLAGCFVFVFDKNSLDRLQYLHCLPFIFLCLMGVFVYHYKRTMGLQGYKRYIENEINHELNNKTLLYGELGLRYMVKRDVLGVINFLVYIPIYIGLVYLADSKNVGMECWTNVNIMLGIMFLLISIPIFTFSKKIERKSYELAAAGLKGV